MHELKKFIDAYFKILFESSQGDVFSSDYMISKPITVADFKKAVIDAKLYDPDEPLLYDPSKFNEISEAKFFDEIVSTIMSMKSGSGLQRSMIISKVNKDWQYYEDFKLKCQPFYVLRCHCADKKSLVDLFNHYVIGDLDDSIIQLFIKKMKNAPGAYLHQNSFRAIILNEDCKLNENVVIHEFTHYLQDILGIFKNDDIKSIDRAKLSYLHLNDEDLDKLLSFVTGNEMMAYIMEFIETAKKIYDAHKETIKSLNPDLFIEYINANSLSEDLSKSQLYMNFVKFSGYAEPLLVYAACMALDIQKKTIIKMLKEELEK